MVSNEDLSPIYTELGRDDVLLGRGTGPNEHIGNVRFRAIAIEMMLELEPTGDSFPERLTATMKSKLAKKLCEEVRSRGGKFVKKVGIFNKGGNKTKRSQGCYFQEVPLSVAVEKARQSFRHQLRVSSKPTSSGSSLREALARKSEIIRSTSDKRMNEEVPPNPLAAPKDSAACHQAVNIPAPAFAPFACEAMHPAGIEESVQKLNLSRYGEGYMALQRNSMSNLIPLMHYLTRTETIDQQLKRLSFSDTSLLGLVTSLGTTRKPEYPAHYTMADQHAACLPRLLSMEAEQKRRFLQMAGIQTLPTWASTNYGNSFDQDIELVQKMLLLNKGALTTDPSASCTAVRSRPISASDMDAVVLEVEMERRRRSNYMFHRN